MSREEPKLFFRILGQCHEKAFFNPYVEQKFPQRRRDLQRLRTRVSCHHFEQKKRKLNRRKDNRKAGRSYRSPNLRSR